MMTGFRNTMVVLHTCATIAIFVCGGACEQRPVAAFDGTAKGINLRYGPPDYAYHQVLRPSPDGRYIARLLNGDGEVAYLTVYSREPGRHRYRARYAVSPQFEDVHGCVWVPGHGHWLIVSSGGADYGRGKIALWTGNRHIRYLRYAKAPDDEGFNVRSVSSNGRFIIYEHFGENSADPDDKRNTHYKLLLPKS